MVVGGGGGVEKENLILSSTCHDLLSAAKPNASQDHTLEVAIRNILYQVLNK